MRYYAKLTNILYFLQSKIGKEQRLENIKTRGSEAAARGRSPRTNPN